MSNNIKIYTQIQGLWVSNFTLKEFENPLGWVVLHERIPWALELARDGLNAQRPGEDIVLFVTDCTRTQQQLEALARRLGWVDEGGAVARNSFHLVKYGGVAVDFTAYSRKAQAHIPALEVAKVAQLYFDWVRHYTDGHVHGDLRSLVTR